MSELRDPAPWVTACRHRTRSSQPYDCIHRPLTATSQFPFMGDVGWSQYQPRTAGELEAMSHADQMHRFRCEVRDIFRASLATLAVPA